MQGKLKQETVKRNILLTPGPATTTDSVKYAQVVPDICPREKEFQDIMDRIRKDLVKIVHGDDDYTSVLFAGSGTAVMDVCINSVVPLNGKTAIVNNGAYGERMIRIARAYHIPCVEIAFDWGKRPDVERVRDILEKDGDVNCLVMIHHETTTGLLNPIKEIGELAKENNCTFIVDAISSYAGIPIDIKECNVDFMCSTSNKCIQGMAGLAFVICRKDALKKTKDYPTRSFYLNLYQQYEYFEKHGQMQFTPPVQVIYALKQAIIEYFEEGEENRYERYVKNWQTLRAGLKEMGFEFLLKEEEEARLLITVLYPKNPAFDFDKMHDLLYNEGFTIYPGKVGKVGTFRLANLGAIDEKDISDFLKKLREVLHLMGVNQGKTTA
jgi:2-aminoethylphosphonate aminotransferase